MMFIGVDHGTTGIRFACLSDECDAVRIYEMSREEAARTQEVLNAVERGLKISLKSVKMVALTYSMGDGISQITNIRSVEDRGLREDTPAAGKRIGGGTRVFDAFKYSELPVILIPGIHADLRCVDRRMRFFSHGASPEKVGIAYHIFKKGFKNFVFSDISSNTVSVAVADGTIVGAIDACIFAPGLLQGPLDLQLLRDVERGVMSANEAFSNAGVLRKFGFRRRFNFQTSSTTHRNVKSASSNTSAASAESLSEITESEKEEIFETIALFAAMEISALLVLMRDVLKGGCSHNCKKRKDERGEGKSEMQVFLTGAVGESERMRKRVSELLCDVCDVQCHSITKNSASIGCAEIARDVFKGERNILGIPVKL